MRVKACLADRQNASKNGPTIKDKVDITDKSVISFIWSEMDTHILVSFEKVSFRLFMRSKTRIDSTFKDGTIQNRKPISDVANAANKLLRIIGYANILIALE
ncbi:hypothetical protein V8G54_029292 [Vigna mungo]|uniref:Uncharacterized protein n=1 Tax=Vigna mungo TaxID=3915 RepID=A0AAQ3MU23_VIGMU